MSLANMVRTIKQIHPEDVVLIKIGVFYHAYGKDAYIIRCKEQKKARSHILVNCQAKINKNSHIKLSNYSQVKKYILSTGIIQHSFYLQLNI